MEEILQESSGKFGKRVGKGTDTTAVLLCNHYHSCESKNIHGKCLTGTSRLLLTLEPAEDYPLTRDVHSFNLTVDEHEPLLQGNHVSFHAEHVFDHDFDMIPVSYHVHAHHPGYLPEAVTIYTTRLGEIADTIANKSLNGLMNTNSFFRDYTPVSVRKADTLTSSCEFAPMEAAPHYHR